MRRKPRLTPNRIIILRNLAAIPDYAQFLRTPKDKRITIGRRSVHKTPFKASVCAFEKLRLAKRIETRKYTRGKMPIYRLTTMGLMCAFLEVKRALAKEEITEERFVTETAKNPIFSDKLPLVLGRWPFFVRKFKERSKDRSETSAEKALRNLLFHVMKKGAQEYLAEQDAPELENEFPEFSALLRKRRRALYDEDHWAQWVTEHFLMLYPILESKQESGGLVDYEVLEYARELWDVLDADEELRDYKAVWVRHKMREFKVRPLASSMFPIPETLFPALLARLLDPRLDKVVRAFDGEDFFCATLLILDMLVGVPFENKRDLDAVVKQVAHLTIMKLRLRHRLPKSKAWYPVVAQDREIYVKKIAIPSRAALLFFDLAEVKVWDRVLFTLKRSEIRRLESDYADAKLQAFNEVGEIWKARGKNP